MDLQITLSDYEAQVLSTEYNDIDFLFNSQLIGRFNQTESTALQKTVAYCIENGMQVPATKEEIIQLGFDQGVLTVISQNQPTPTPPAPTTAGDAP